MNDTGRYWWLLNIGSGKGLVPSGNRPLPEPLLTQISEPYGVTRPKWVNYSYSPTILRRYNFSFNCVIFSSWSTVAVTIIIMTIVIFIIINTIKMIVILMTITIAIVVVGVVVVVIVFVIINIVAIVLYVIIIIFAVLVFVSVWLLSLPSLLLSTSWSSLYHYCYCW